MLHLRKYSYLAGFSLIELIVVIMLIGIFTTMALTRTDTGLTTIKEQIAIDQITNDIDLARSMAFARNETIIIMFDKDQESYGVYNGSGIIKTFPNSDSDGIISLGNPYLKNVDIKLSQLISFLYFCTNKSLKMKNHPPHQRKIRLTR